MSQQVTLDTLLYECTKNTDQALDATAVNKFCDAVNKDLDGPTTAARLLGHKIQSPQEQESLNALCVTDECIKKCGRKFQDEIGKFRFLNEIIKMISPKYFGERTSKKVKEKCIELLYRWSVELRHEPKINDAYEMLKRQGIIDDDPIIVESNGHESSAAAQSPTATAPTASSMPPEKEEAKDSIFTDEEKSKLLARLLKSKHPDDLQAANRLIKNMVKQEEEKQEKISQRYHLLETVKNNVKLLNEMLDCYQMAGGSSTSDKDIIRELHQNIEAERPKLFKLASDTEGSDSEGMSQILQVNDDVVQISNRYKQVVEQGAGDVQPSSKETPRSTALSDDLAGLDLGTSSSSTDLFSGFEAAPVTSTRSNQVSSSHNGILDLFSSPPSYSSNITSTAAPTSSHNMFSQPLSPQSRISNQSSMQKAQTTLTSNTQASKSSSDLDDLFSSTSGVTSVFPTQPPIKSSASVGDDIGLLSLDSTPTQAGLAAPLLPGNEAMSLFDTGEQSENLFDTKKSALEDLDFLGQDLLQKTKPQQPRIQPTAPAAPTIRPSLNQLKASNIDKTLAQSLPAAQSTKSTTPTPASPSVQVQPLTNVFVPIDSVKPGELQPLSVYDKDSVKVILHFTKNKPREDVIVMVLSMMSTKTTPIKLLVFQAAVPKSMKVKLQPPSGTELPAYNPILPPSAITQVMILANPAKEKVKLKYKLSYMINGSQVTEMGDVNNIPL